MLIIMRFYRGQFGWREQVYAVYNGTRKQANATVKQLNKRSWKWNYEVVGSIPMMTPKEN